MRFFALHDEQGNIAALLVHPLESPTAGVMAEPGQLVTEVDAPDVTIDPTDPETYQRLVDVIEHFRVEAGAKRSLMRKVPEKP